MLLLFMVQVYLNHMYFMYDWPIDGCIYYHYVLDELVQKGWGLGSGISLFIMAGVAQQILWSLFSPLPAGDGGAVGIIPYIGQSIMNHDLSNVLFRSNQLPSIFCIIPYSWNTFDSGIYSGNENRNSYCFNKIQRILSSISNQIIVYFKHSSYFSICTNCKCSVSWSNVMGQL